MPYGVHTLIENCNASLYWCTKEAVPSYCGCFKFVVPSLVAKHHHGPFRYLQSCLQVVKLYKVFRSAHLVFEVHFI